MGNSTSTQGGPTAEVSSPSFNYVSRCRQYLDTRLAETIKEKWAQGERGSPMKLNKLLLKLPTMYEGLDKAAKVFASLDTPATGEISLEQLRAGARQLGYVVDDDLLESAFVSADLDRNSTINVDEFVVILAILHLVRGPLDDEEEVDPATLRAFEAATRAFLSFDSSREGFISRDELMQALLEPSLENMPHSPAATSLTNTIAPLVQQRFLELDQDGNGRITFPDFLATISNWVEDAGDPHNGN